MIYYGITNSFIDIQICIKNEANEDFSIMDQYRGQNANMHACEAAIWAYEATGQINPYLNRAKTLAYSVAKNLASKTIHIEQNSDHNENFSSEVQGFIWEHYDTKWNIDFEYNKVIFISRWTYHE